VQNGDAIDTLPRAHYAAITSILALPPYVWTSSLDKTIKVRRVLRTAADGRA
jgi:hypothetical protein